MLVLLLRQPWSSFWFICFAATSLLAQSGSIAGRVTTISGNPIPFAEVFVLDLNRSTHTNNTGQYQFDQIPNGSHQLQVITQNRGNQLKTIIVAANETVTVHFKFDIQIHEDLIVTATPQRKSISDVSHAVSVYNQQDLLEKSEPTIGATLEREPGIHSTYFGPGAGRPVIRGLSGDRIRILEGGLDTGDASSISGDHAVSIDTLTTDRIEILRGPAALRYGSNAVGGVINIIDNRIPEFLPNELIGGEVELRANTVAEQRAGGFMLDGGMGDIAWHLDFSKRDTGNYAIPSDSGLEPRAGETGILANSSLTTEKGAIGFSLIKDYGFFGLAYTQFDSNYGIPGDGHEVDQLMSEEESSVRIDLNQKRFDFRTGLNLHATPFQTLNLRFGQTDYEHVELENGQTGTRFFNETQEARVELVHGNWASFTSGTFGLNYKNRHFQAIGEEAFVPPNETNQWAVFFYEEIDKETWSISAGIRLERQETDRRLLEKDPGKEGPDEDGVGQPASLTYDGLSSSLGIVIFKDNPFSYAINLTQTERPPTPEELFSNGPHLAARSFELGNPHLIEESSLGANIFIRRSKGAISGEINLFANRFDNFIYQADSGEVVDGLTEFVFQQQDADFHGGEIHIDATLWHTEPHHLNFEIMVDVVRAALASGENLPRISPTRYRAVLTYRQNNFWIKSSTTRTASQSQIAPFETTTDGFTILDTSASYHFLAGGLSHQVLLRGNNLTNEIGRIHTSFLKDQIILPGRNITLAYRLQF